MTKEYLQKVQCPYCNNVHTIESGFARWMRNERELDSIRSGIVTQDLDLIVHVYKSYIDRKYTREVQCLMFVEVKTYSAKPSPAQIDTLSIMSQVLRNRRNNNHSKKKGLHAENHNPYAKVLSKITNRKIDLRMFGGHLLQMSNDNPVESVLKWDYKEIDLKILIGLLKFELDPDNPYEKISIRRRHHGYNDKNEFPFIKVMYGDPTKPSQTSPQPNLDWKDKN